MTTTAEGAAAAIGPEAAGAHVATAVPTAAPDDTAADALAALRGRRFAAVDYVYVLSRDGAFAGAVETRDLFAAEGRTPLRALVVPDLPAIGPDVDQERAATLAVRHGCSALPVVDAAGAFRGAVPAQALLAILRREHVEDLHRIAGIHREGQRSLAALEDPPVRRARHRLPWLLVGFAGSLVAAALVARFDDLLARRVEVACFLPSIVYLADAVGTQTEAIAVRGLSLARTPWRRLLGGEVRTGLWIGTLLAAIALPVVWLAVGSSGMAVTVALSILLACSLACGIGMLLPTLLSRLGSDPAFGSGPLGTIVQDLLSIATYLLVARAMLG